MARDDLNQDMPGDMPNQQTYGTPYRVSIGWIYHSPQYETQTVDRVLSDVPVDYQLPHSADRYDYRVLLQIVAGVPNLVLYSQYARRAMLRSYFHPHIPMSVAMQSTLNITEVTKV